MSGGMTQLFDTSDPRYHAYATVALERSIDASTGFTYGVPPAMKDLEPGERVVVPLGRSDRKVAGYVTNIEPSTTIARVKPILERDGNRVGLTMDLIKLAQWMAAYYCAPIGMVFANMLPAAVKKGTGIVVEICVELTEDGQRVAIALAASAKVEVPSGLKLSKLQKAALSVMKDRPTGEDDAVTMRDLADLAGAKTVTPVKQLIDKALLRGVERSSIRAARNIWTPTEHELPMPPRVTLNAEQASAVDHLTAQLHNGFSVSLLHGVTGSGKTEVYLRMIEGLLAQRNDAPKIPRQEREMRGPSVIVLVPEIALTPQTSKRFHERFDNVAVLHSGLTAAQRHEQWQRIRRGEAHIVVGARSAIFAPLANLKLIVVDEEHETSYKQDQVPRYHARDVAIKRAQLCGVPIVLGSATPSLESYYNTAGFSQATGADHQGSAKRNFHLLKLPNRVTGLMLPEVDIVDMRDERRKRYQMTGKTGWHLLSLRLEKQLQQTMKEGGQAILLLNRRGYGNFIGCADQHGCAWVKFCDYCDATMVYHRDKSLPAGGLIRCHHCDAEQLLPKTCPDCGRAVNVFGLGTQRVEEEIERLCPDAPMMRMDSDSMRRGADYHDALERFRSGELRILVGTQMIAKGLDFPNVRVVGVINADTSLHLPDFRSAERTFQLIAQVAGRAGRGTEPGRVIVQTFNPNDPAIQLASKHDYETFARRELALREKTALPPITRMARIVLRDRDQMQVIKAAAELARDLKTFIADLNRGIRMRGPAPCPIARVAEFHRHQIELIAPDASTLQLLLTRMRNAKLIKSDAKMAIDVDPVALL